MIIINSYISFNQAQPGKYSYSRILDGSGNDQVFSVTCDSSGNIYICGRYQATPTIRDQDGTPLGTLTAASVFAAFMSKFDASGNYLYSRIFDASSFEVWSTISCDSIGNVYVGGNCNGTVTIKDQNGSPLGTLPAYNGATAFMCKFSASGTYLYSRIFDAISNDVTNRITCDSGDNVYMCGWYDRAATIRDQNGNSVGTLPSVSNQTAFMAKFSASGNYLYSRIFDGNGSVCINVSRDSGDNVYMVGYYNISVTVKDQNGSPIGSLPVTGGFVGFMSKFDASGNYLYSRILDGTANFEGVTCDSGGNVYVSGHYSGTATIRDQNGTPIGTLPAFSNESSLMCKFSASGNYLYSRILDSGGNDRAYGMTCDSGDNVYVSGYYNGTPTIYNQIGTPLGTLPASSSQAGFMCKFDASGNYLYSRILDGSGNDTVRDVTRDSSGNVYMIGDYNGTATIRDQIGTPLGTLPSASVETGILICFTQ